VLTSGDEKRSSREFDELAAGINTSAMAGDLAAAQAYALELGSFLDPAARRRARHRLAPAW
jgi:hypothetical protein